MFAAKGLQAPRARQRESRRIVHRQELVDEFAWLRADNWQEILADPAKTPADIRAYLDAENAYAEAALAPVKALRKSLAAEMRGRIVENDSSVPLPDGPFAYYTRYRAGGQHPLYCRRPRSANDDAQEQILLDGDALAQGKNYFHFGATIQSPDHRLVAWASDDTGSELFTLRVRDLASGRDLDDCVRRSDGAIVWARDGRSLLYVRVDDNHRTAQVFRHWLGQDESADELVIEEPDPGWFVHLHETGSGRFAVVAMRDHDSAENWLIDLDDSAAAPRLVAPREAKIRYDVSASQDRLIIRTNADGAEDFKLVETPLDATDRAHWRDLAPYRDGCMIIAFAVTARHIVRLERENGLPRLVVRDMARGPEHAIAFDEEAYDIRLIEGFEFDTDILRFAYSSMTTPQETYDYDMVTRVRVLRKRQDIPSGHRPSDYVTRRIFARAQDGEMVPVTLLARADRTGPAPCLLYAYGAYGHALPAAFASNRLSLVDRGFVFAIAHVRGGTDKGWRWYEHGKLKNKPNTFSDYICAARKLIEDGWTQGGRIVAHGGSAGGMLMGAVANMAPELFAGIIADVPFVDVVNTMLDADLPLTPPEWLEWGNPIEDDAAFATMLSYSPYDNVAAQDYPPILALGGLTDPRVTYWEPAKWVARLRARMTGGGPILLVTNMEAGHGGASGRFEQLDEVALEQAFALAATQTAPAATQDV